MDSRALNATELWIPISFSFHNILTLQEHVHHVCRIIFVQLSVAVTRNYRPHSFNYIKIMQSVNT